EIHHGVPRGDGSAGPGEDDELLAAPILPAETDDELPKPRQQQASVEHKADNAGYRQHGPQPRLVISVVGDHLYENGRGIDFKISDIQHGAHIKRLHASAKDKIGRARHQPPKSFLAKILVIDVAPAHIVVDVALRVRAHHEDAEAALDATGHRVEDAGK